MKRFVFKQTLEYYEMDGDHIKGCESIELCSLESDSLIDLIKKFGTYVSNYKKEHDHQIVEDGIFNGDIFIRFEVPGKEHIMTFEIKEN